MDIKVVYLDDEIHQHIAFESLLPEEWEILCFDNPMEAIDCISREKPAIVISDQRMPQMPGFKFLEMVKNLSPNSVRIITTGYNDENSIVESIRAAQIYDYIVKPWDTEKLLASLTRAVQFHVSERERRELNDKLQSQNNELTATCETLTKTLNSHQILEKELKCWVHPFVLQAAERKINFPVKKEIATLVIDIIDSSNIHNKVFNDIPLRVRVLQSCWETVLKHGGEVESQEGDKIYANFGLLDNTSDMCKAAYAAAKEFRSSLLAISEHYEVNIECGIGLHLAKDCSIYLRKVAVNMGSDIVVRKKFDTSSLGIDLAHRIETVAHDLPGSNIILTKTFAESLKNEHKEKLEFLGKKQFKGQMEESELYILRSMKVSDEDLKNLKNNFFSGKESEAA